MEQILIPSTIEINQTDRPNVSEVIITPCHQGYGVTLGNSLRRVLLSSIQGAAVEAFKIEGVQHEFSGIDGIQEDAVNFMLNLKQLAIISHSEQPVRLNLSKKGKGDVTAADFEKNSDIEIINKDLKIATLNDDKKTFNLEIIIGKGMGYVPASEKDSKNLDLGTILTDSFYSPVKDVGYKIENTRVGDITDYEKLILTIETNGTISPKEAVTNATNILMNHFSAVLDAAQSDDTDSKEETSQEGQE